MRARSGLSLLRVGRLSLGLLPATFVAACADKSPARIEFVRPADVSYGRAAQDLRAHVVTKAGTVLSEHAVAVSAVPTNVATAVGGAVVCTGTGDASVSLAGGGLSTNFVMSCRLVDKIVAPPSLRLIAGTDSVSIDFAALDSNGTPMDDVRVAATLTDESVAAVREGKLVGLHAGIATLALSAGDARAAVEVTVIERLFTDNLVLDDGASQTRTFERGNYRIEVNVVASNGSDHGVEAEWVGEACQGSPENQSFAVDCRVNNAASLILRNPTSWGFGPSATGNIIGYRVPDGR